jgi:glycerol-3-phosphate acyltransferase PlsY
VVGPLLVIGLSIWGDFPWPWSVAIAALAAIIVWHHRSNIDRLLHGTERKFGNKEAATSSGTASHQA